MPTVFRERFEAAWLPPVPSFSWHRCSRSARARRQDGWADPSSTPYMSTSLSSPSPTCTALHLDGFHVPLLESSLSSETVNDF